MNFNKKKVLVVALAVCLVGILSFGTLAWFTDTERVDNIFKVTTSDETGDPDFNVEIFETEVDPQTGKIGDGDGDGNVEEVKGNTYNAIAPGDTLDKNPTVRNGGQYDQWVRVKVTISDYATWCAVKGANYDFTEILNGISPNGWTKDNSPVVNGEYATYTYYLNSKLKPGDTATLFTSVTIPSEFTVENMFAQFELDVVAEAIQADNTGNNAQIAFQNCW